ncbi:ISL3 family transposase [Chitinophaga sancti]|uniref:Transposase n=1 Tax=Chitinophaga sancti TaxID=1004 RepID=A0A1K1T2I9_9BACT|nr:Transposase [Chitinophaga sancti]
MEKALKCTTSEIKSFAKGILSDFTAVHNAILLKWSNGPVEGQINKLKTIKRQIYGRCSLELLKRRLVIQLD